MKIAIIGTLGIPAKYGGFETLTEFLTKYIGNKIEFTVYCSSKAYQTKFNVYNSAKLVYIPLRGNGFQSIPYDIISLFKAARTNDKILLLGISGSLALPIFRIFYKHKKLFINVDGLEHRRKKWNRLAQIFLKFSEKLAIKYADHIISDNEAIKKYLFNEYGKESVLIKYGGNQVSYQPLSKELKKKYSIPENFAFNVCRIEPENNIHIILDAFSSISFPIVIVGNWMNSTYGSNLKTKYEVFSNLYLLDPIYDQKKLNEIRSNCTVYIHGHQAGGTNPSLVEAMSLGLPIISYDCDYNQATTFNKALYFSDVDELKNLIQFATEANLNSVARTMLQIAKENYTWEIISNQYYELLL